MKNKIFIGLLSLLLIACEPVSSQAQNTQSGNYSKPQKMKEKSFEWNWLSGLEAKDFDQNNVYDKNYYFLVDGSGSMSERASRCSANQSGTKIDVAKDAIFRFVNTLPDNVNLGLLAFDNDGISERLKLGKYSKSQFKQVLFSIEANGGTPLKSSTKMAYTNIKNQALKQAGHGEYNLIIITDGEANMGEDPKSIIENIALNSPINLFAIGFCIDENHSLNNPQYVNYFTANDADTIISSLTKVVAESEFTN